jgi:hypothetical protein
MTKKIYKEGFIYLIESADGCLKYIGSTSNFQKRMNEHKCDYYRYVNKKFHYCSSFDIIKDPGYTSKILEKHINIMDNDLRKREGEIIRQYKGVNKIITGRTQKEWRIDNNDKIKTYSKNYNESHKAEINKKMTCKCGGRYTKINKTHHEKSTLHKDFLKKQEDQQKLKDSINKVLEGLKLQALKIDASNNSGTIHLHLNLYK